MGPPVMEEEKWTGRLWEPYSISEDGEMEVS